MKLKMMNLNGIKLKLQLRLPFMIFKNSSLFWIACQDVLDDAAPTHFQNQCYALEYPFLLHMVRNTFS